MLFFPTESEGEKIAFFLKATSQKAKPRRFFPKFNGRLRALKIRELQFVPNSLKIDTITKMTLINHKSQYRVQISPLEI